VDDTCEVQKVRLLNKSKKPKKIKLFSFVELCLWNALDDMTNFRRNLSTGEVEVEGSVIYHKTEYRERRNHYAFYSAGAPLSGFDTDRDFFLGLYNGFDKPDTVFAARPNNSIAHGWSPVASHCIDTELGPGEERQIVFVLGYIENPDDEKFITPGIINKKRAEAMIARYDTVEKTDLSLKALEKHLDNLLSAISVDHEDPRLKRMVNIWNPYQCMVTYNMSRNVLVSFTDNLVSLYLSSPYRVSLDFFKWGSNSDVANQALLKIVAHKLNGDQKYILSIQGDIDYILGRNATGYCFVTGFGSKSPMNIHHRPSGADGVAEPVPGFLAGGPNTVVMNDCDTIVRRSAYPAKSYTDTECSYSTNEICINWNAPLIFVLGALDAGVERLSR